MSADTRIATAERALAAYGLAGATVEVEGHEQEIAALRVPEAAWARLLGSEGATLADAVKAAGFRYVALDLAVGEAD